MSTTYAPGTLVRVRYGDVDQLGIVRPRTEAFNNALEVAYVSGGFDMLASLLESKHHPTTVEVLYQTKPEEPTGLGAVVEDAEGNQYLRAGVHLDCNDWRLIAGGSATGHYHWVQVDAVRVLSEGLVS